MVDHFYRPPRVGTSHNAQYMNPFSWINRHPPNRANAKELYGAIVAQARLPVFYATFQVPDTLQGRLSMLTVHIFVVLHRLKTEFPESRALAQELIDLFSADMDTVLREMGVSDLKVPARVRDICAKSHGVINGLEEAHAAGGDAFRDALAELLPVPPEEMAAASRGLSSYLQRAATALRQQSLSALRRGRVEFPEVDDAEEP